MTSKKHSNAQQAYWLLIERIKEVGLTRDGFLDRLADLNPDFAYTKNTLKTWGRSGRRIPANWPLIQGMIQVLSQGACGEEGWDAAEGLKFAILLDMPFAEVMQLEALFPLPEFQTALSQYWPSSDEEPEESEPPYWLPDKLYTELVGRDALVNQIIDALRDEGGRRMVGIDGMGGIGKTALAREVAEICLHEGDFDALVWASAARSEFPSEGGSGLLTLSSVLDTIARHLGVPEIAKLPLAEKKARVRLLLARQQTLIVLDNLETAGEPQDQIARQIQPLLASGSKALLTSRDRFGGDLYHRLIHLTGLDESSALSLIIQIAGEKHIPHVASAQTSALLPIAHATGGSPLALRLVVGLLNHLPLDIVLEHLRQVRPLSDNYDEDEYIRFYKFIFLHSWKQLSDSSKQLLICMAHFVPQIGGDFDDVMAISGLTRQLFSPSIEQLWRLSFLEIGPVLNLTQIHYYLHALTQHFVLADIVEIL